MSIPTTLTRRTLIIAAALAASAATGVHAEQKKPGIPLEIWKDPSCGCCKDWVEHMQANGFAVKVHETGNNAVRAQLGIDMKYASCHTAVVGGYALEGHVPAREVHRLLKEKPQARGLAVPGMPIGSPGMDGPAYGGRQDGYDVVLLGRGGDAKVYQHYRGTRPAAAVDGADMADGEVRKVDKEAGKVTLRHGPIKNLDMPPMTMVFKATDPKLLDKVKAGDKVRFVAARDSGGGFTVNAIEPAR